MFWCWDLFSWVCDQHKTGINVTIYLLYSRNMVFPKRTKKNYIWSSESFQFPVTVAQPSVIWNQTNKFSKQWQQNLHAVEIMKLMGLMDAIMKHVVDFDFVFLHVMAASTHWEVFISQMNLTRCFSLQHI